MTIRWYPAAVFLATMVVWIRWRRRAPMLWYHRGICKAGLAAQVVSLIIQSPARTQLDSAEVVLHCTISPVGVILHWNADLAELECSVSLLYILSPWVLQRYSSGGAGVLLALVIFFSRTVRSADSEAVPLEQVAQILLISLYWYCSIGVFYMKVILKVNPVREW